MRKLLLCTLALLAVSACAETDPYRRADAAPTPELSPAGAGHVFITRWPEQFKCVQTVTLDFGPVTRTLVGYLIIQQPGQFRLQGMSEQGLKLFEIAHNGTNAHTIFATEDFDARLLENVSRDIQRVFLENQLATGGRWWRTSLGAAGLVFQSAPEATVKPGSNGTRVHFERPHHTLSVNFVGDPPKVDWYDFRQSGRSQYRVDHYEWADFDGLWLPSTIVLRERGVQSKGPSYKLTIKITEFTPRAEPWPDSIFEAEGD